MLFCRLKKIKVVITRMLFLFCFAHTANAGLISVVADVNTSTSASQSFFSAILGSGANVVFSRDSAQQSSLISFYDGLSGVSATQNSAVVNASLLSAVDLLVVTSGYNASLNYSVQETQAIASYLSGGGSLLMISESSQSALLNSYNAFLSAVGSSIQYTGGRYVEYHSLQAQGSTLGALSALSVAAYNTLSGGTSVYESNNGSIVAIEEVVGENANDLISPNPLALFSLAFILLLVRRFA